MQACAARGYAVLRRLMNLPEDEIALVAVRPRSMTRDMYDVTKYDTSMTRVEAFALACGALAKYDT